MRRINLAFTLLLTMLVISSCSKGSDDGEFTPSGGNGSLKMTIGAMSPSLASEVIVASQDGVEVNTQFSVVWSDTPTTEVWAKQSGELVYFGKLNVAIASSDKKNGMIEFDGTGKLDESKPYEVYGLGCSWRRDGNELFYRTDLHRNGIFGTYFKVVGQKGSVSTTKRIAGTVEVLYVINKTDKVIKFKHKGFDAENKWYYTHAEVSIDKGTIVNTEQGAEVAGEDTNIPAFTGKNARGIYSYYVPNSNKIKDAQLIAEIDGQEVRSENRISSDITLLTDHAYGIFAVWDGEKLTLGDGSEPEVIDLTDPESSSIEVVSLESDGTMALMTTVDKVPNVGDYLWSAPTKIAPYGYLVRVEDVKMSANSSPSTRGVDEIIAYLKTVAANINEIVETGNLDKTFDVNFDDIKIEKVTDAQGNELEFVETEQKEWKVPLKGLNIGPFTVTPDIIIRPKALSYYFKIEDYDFKNMGVDFDFDMESSILVDATLSSHFEKTFVLYHVFLKPIVFKTPPIVITPLFQVYLSFEADGSMKFSCVPVKNKHSIHIGANYDVSSDVITPSKGHKKVLDVTDIGKGLVPWADMEKGFELKGAFRASFGASYSAGLYGCNYIGRVDFLGNKLDFLADLVGFDAWVDLWRETKASVGINNINMKTGDDFKFTDACSSKNALEGHFDFNLSFYNPLKKKKHGFTKTLETEPVYFWNEEHFPSLFCSEFSDFTATMSNEIITFSARKYMPFFRYTLFEEYAFGFRYAQCDDGNEKTIKEWVDLDISNNYAGKKSLWDFDVNSSLPISKFEKGHIYVVYPYAYVKNPIGEFMYIHRQGIKIRVNFDGTLTKNILSVVPGEDL